ncbi:MAG: terminase small subunit [Clostridium perfringens]
MNLILKQKASAEYYIKTDNTTESAIKARYSKKTAKEVGYENLTKPHIKSYIDEKMEELESKSISKEGEVLEYLNRVVREEETEQVVVTENIGDFMSEAKIVDKEISTKDKIKAAELLVKRYKLFVDKVEKNSNVNVNFTTKLDSIINQLKHDDNK